MWHTSGRQRVFLDIERLPSAASSSIPLVLYLRRVGLDSADSACKYWRAGRGMTQVISRACRRRDAMFSIGVYAESNLESN